MKIMDLHSHTNYSACGKDDPEELVRFIIGSGIEVFGISDHNYGIGERKEQYLRHIGSLKEKYKKELKLLVGIEISALPHLFDVKDGEIALYDYCIAEHIDCEDSLAYHDPVSFLSKFQIPAGIAHTDLFAYCEKTGRDAAEFLKELANNNIFWELNVNFDSIHGYREHQYVKDFFESEEKQEIVKQAGLILSVGFDGHNMDDYLPEKVIDACEKIKLLGLKSAEEIF